MAGYDYLNGMSNNAVSAYEAGRKPLSKFTAQDLKSAGIACTLSFAKWLAKNNKWTTSEWHHSGGTWYNTVEFYDLEDLRCLLNEATDEELQDWKTSFQNKPQAVEVVAEVRVSGNFLVWGGTRRHPRVIEKKQFTGTLKDDWIYLDDGGRKKASGNSISYQVAA